MEHNTINTRTYTADIINHTSSMEKEALTIKLEKEVLEIKELFQQVERREKTLMAIRTRVWCKLGKILIEHKIHVLQAGYTWEVWVADHFPYIKERRRQECMKLGEYNEESLKPFYHLGFDRLYALVTKLQPYRNDPDYIYLTKNVYRHVFYAIQQDTEDKELFNSKVDIIIEYFKLKQNIGRVFDIELVLAALEAGVHFAKDDYEYLKTNSDDDCKLYLTKMIATGSSPSNTLSQSKSRTSLHVLLAQLIETLRDHNNSNKCIEILPASLIDEIINLLIKSRNRSYSSHPDFCISDI